MKKKYFALEKKAVNFLKRYAISILIDSVSLIYFWYGLLKVLDRSAAEQLVYDATHWMGIDSFIVLLGIWEMVIGICLPIKKLRRIGLLLLFLQFPGTFLPLFLTPENCFNQIPFDLTLEGKYIFKNIILIAAGLVMVSTLDTHPRKKEKVA